MKLHSDNGMPLASSVQCAQINRKPKLKYCSMSSSHQERKVSSVHQMFYASNVISRKNSALICRHCFSFNRPYVCSTEVNMVLQESEKAQDRHVSFHMHLFPPALTFLKIYTSVQREGDKQTEQWDKTGQELCVQSLVDIMEGEQDSTCIAGQRIPFWQKSEKRKKIQIAEQVSNSLHFNQGCNSVTNTSS